jgi:enoyl-CoA hydratase
LTFAINGMWKVEDADQGAGIRGFIDKDDLWQQRRGLALDFWVDGVPERAS